MRFYVEDRCLSKYSCVLFLCDLSSSNAKVILAHNGFASRKLTSSGLHSTTLLSREFRNFHVTLEVMRICVRISRYLLFLRHPFSLHVSIAHASKDFVSREVWHFKATSYCHFSLKIQSSDLLLEVQSKCLNIYLYARFREHVFSLHTCVAFNWKHLEGGKFGGSVLHCTVVKC